MKIDTVLFVDDEEHLRFAAEQSLQLDGLSAQCFGDAEAALGQLKRDFPGVLVTDIRLPGMDGLMLMRRALEIDPAFPVILVTGQGDVELAVNSMRDGAYDFLEKPFAPSRLTETVRRALEKRRLTLENRVLRRQVDAREAIDVQIHGQSAVMAALRQQVRRVAAAEVDVLILGETGVGKEVAARALHQASNRANMPFIQINCAALPADMIERELFGHEAGAFAGAMRTRVGRFEAARGGTVLLDEIDCLSQAMQAKLLHAIQNRVIARLGSNERLELDVRFVATSKLDLVKEAQAGRFRADLLYRLNVVTLQIPPLRERREDVPNLFLQLVAEAAARYKREVAEVSGAVLSSIAAQEWPGNVRELRNAADRYVLGFDLALGRSFDEHLSPDRPGLAEQLADHEKALVAASLAANGGRLKDTYESLRISRKALYEKMQKYGLSRDDFLDDD
ncbi:MAG: Fis family transcriptional regulator [Rhodobacteraceae bacterium]|nr:Fis family transcriptional regulator [Paracoccaceae bacterium]